MPDQPVLYIRGPFPYAGAVPDGLPSDLRVLLQIPREQFERFQKALADYSGFLDQPGLLELLKGHFPDGALGDVIGRIIRFADSQRSIVQGYPERLFDRFTSLEENGKRIFSETEASLLKERLSQLVLNIPGLDRQTKAEELAAATGQRLQRIQLICDFRPIFDKKRETVEGLIPFTTLKLTCTGTDGLPVSMEAILSASDVERLCEAAGLAREKLQKLREMANRNQIRVPMTDLTRPGNVDAD